MRRLCALASILFFSPSLHADDTGDATRLVDEGIAFYKKKDYASARAAFSRARDLVPDKANPYRWLGVTDAALNRCAEAIGELDTFLQRVPKNDPRTIEAMTIRDRCAAELAPKTGKVTIESAPGEAEVWIDDATGPALGRTPLQRDLPVGSHVVFLRKAGMVEATRTIQIAHRETVRIEVAMTRMEETISSAGTTTPAPPPSKTGVLVVDSSPAGVAVRIDKPTAAPLGNTPLRSDIATGGHIAYLTAPGYKPMSKGIDVGPNEVVRIDAVMQKPSYGWIAGVAVPGALVLGIGLYFIVAAATRPEASQLPTIGMSAQ